MNETAERIPSTAIPWILFGVSLATIAGALLFEHVLGYMPCSLCLTGRQPHYVAMGAALVAGIASRNTNIGLIALVFIGICLIAYLSGAGISLYHMGAEDKWWPGPDSCGAGGGLAASLADLQSALEGGAKPPRCDETAWSLFGLSLAGYNFLISLALAGLSALPLLRYLRESRGEV